MEEPSVLDYVKSQLMPWKNGRVVLPQTEPAPAAPEPAPKAARRIAPWILLLPLAFALAAQRMLEPTPEPSPRIGIFLYLLAGVTFLWVLLRSPGLIQPVPGEEPPVFQGAVLALPLASATLLLLAAFVLFSGNRFTIFNTLIWLAGLVYLLIAIWQRRPGLSARAPLSARLRMSEWNLRITRWALLLALVAGVVIFFRFYHLNSTPAEMFSDQAEKLLDVSDLLAGKTKIFFERNTGREAFQFYLTAAIARVFGTGLSFLSLKLGTALAGLFALPFIYLLGKEIGNRWVGLLALFLCGVAYWPNVIARIGLRFPLYPLFAAPALYFTIRALRTANRNDYLLAGLAVGLGLHGYSPFRFVPFVLVAAAVVYMLHTRSREGRLSAAWGVILIGVVAFAVFLPLFRYLLTNPEMVAYRALTRLSTAERPLPGAPGEIFLGNLWTAMIMFFWKNGTTWVHSIPNRPALDMVTGALFFLGLILVLVRYLRYRNWVDLFLLLSVPLLMMPSILSLAFPEENPSLNRTGGAIVPVFLIAAIALESILRGVAARMGRRWGKTAAGLLAVVLLGLTALLNYNLVFVQFHQNFLRSAWNTTQIGHVIRGFADSVGTPDSAYVIPYPYWVDTRLVGINAGYPTKDYALDVDHIADTLSNPMVKLFIFNTNDQAALDTLTSMYPQGTLSRYTNPLEGKDFLGYLVPGIVATHP